MLCLPFEGGRLPENHFQFPSSGTKIKQGIPGGSHTNTRSSQEKTLKSFKDALCCASTNAAHLFSALLFQQVKRELGEMAGKAVWLRQPAVWHARAYYSPGANWKVWKTAKHEPSWHSSSKTVPGQQFPRRERFGGFQGWRLELKDVELPESSSIKKTHTWTPKTALRHQQPRSCNSSCQEKSSLTCFYESTVEKLEIAEKEENDKNKQI